MACRWGETLAVRAPSSPRVHCHHLPGITPCQYCTAISVRSRQSFNGPYAGAGAFPQDKTQVLVAPLRYSKRWAENASAVWTRRGTTYVDQRVGTDAYYRGPTARALPSCLWMW